MALLIVINETEDPSCTDTLYLGRISQEVRGGIPKEVVLQVDGTERPVELEGEPQKQGVLQAGSQR